MGTLTIYAIKSSITLALLYLPYTLLLRRETFFHFNRAMLLCIVALSLLLPCLDVHIWDNTLATIFEPQRQAISSVVLPTLIVGGSASTAADVPANHTAIIWSTLLVYIYIIGMLFFILWKAVGLIRLISFIPRRCLWTDKQEGATIYCHADRVSPFSWMRAVVVGEQDAVAGSPVLMHELTHVSMRHSWDTLFLSLVEVLQWFNPAIWMLDASLREVHEYEADDAVLRRGISARDYQLLLIEKAVGRNRFTFANSFNHSLLKNRITMMTKKKSPRWARLKVLYAVPLTLVALAAMATQQMEAKMDPLIFINNKRVTKDEVKRLDQKQIAHIEVLQSKPAQQLFGEEAKEGAILITTEEPKMLKAVPGTLRMVVDGQEMTPMEAVKAAEGKDISIAMVEHENTAYVTTTASPDDDQILDKPEVLPEFPELFAWLQKTIKYPDIAKEYGVEGRVYIEFVVEKDGSISNATVLRSPGNSAPDVVVTAYKAKDDSPEELKKEHESIGRKALQDEAIRVVKAMPNWTPGRHKDKPVRTKFFLPVMFRLN